jgi:phytoene desaturase
MAEVLVVGAGVGGLAAAIRLRAAGHSVEVLERNDEVGGKLATRHIDGYTFETGPSLLTLPRVFDELLAVAGTSLADEVDLVRLDPVCRYRFPDGSTFDVAADPADTAANLDVWSPGSAEPWRRFVDRGARTWEVAERTFFAGPMGSPMRLLGRMRSPLDLVAIDAQVSLDRRARSTFDDPRLVAWADRYATYSGSSPMAAPATLGCIPAIEQHEGGWYVRGGLGRLAEALGDVAGRMGVEVRCGVDVDRVVRHGRRVVGVQAAGVDRPADVVVVNADAHHLYVDLLPHRRALARVERAPRSSSGFVLLLGVEGRTDGLAHHNVSFPHDYAAEFTDLFDRRVPVEDPAVYVCCSAVTDPDQAPAGNENWFVLVNAPSGGGTDWSAEAPRYRDRLLDVLAGRGWDLSGRIRCEATITPDDIAARYRAHQGAIYGTSSNGRLAAFLRPGNRGPLRGLYLVGGSSHPGGGLPLVVVSGRIVADLVAADLG